MLCENANALISRSASWLASVCVIHSHLASEPGLHASSTTAQPAPLPSSSYHASPYVNPDNYVCFMWLGLRLGYGQASRQVKLQYQFLTVPLSPEPLRHPKIPRSLGEIQNPEGPRVPKEPRPLKVSRQVLSPLHRVAQTLTHEGPGHSSPKGPPNNPRNLQRVLPPYSLKY